MIGQAEMQSAVRALVLRAPGINCERETARACRLAGFATDLLHINQLVREAERLLDYAFLVIPGGFSYGDDLALAPCWRSNSHFTSASSCNVSSTRGGPCWASATASRSSCAPVCSLVASTMSQAGQTGSTPA